jgi:hypothetical protein
LFAADVLGVDPLAFLGRLWLGVVGGGQEVFDCVVRAWGGIDDEAAGLDGEADGGAGSEVEELENGRGDREHDGAADSAEGRCVHYISI